MWISCKWNAHLKKTNNSSLFFQAIYLGGLPPPSPQQQGVTMTYLYLTKHFFFCFPTLSLLQRNVSCHAAVRCFGRRASRCGSDWPIGGGCCASRDRDWRRHASPCHCAAPAADCVQFGRRPGGAAGGRRRRQRQGACAQDNAGRPVAFTVASNTTFFLLFTVSPFRARQLASSIADRAFSSSSASSGDEKAATDALASGLVGDFYRQHYPPDVLLVAGTGGRSIRVHRFLLAMRVPYFQSRFSSGLVDARESEMVLDDVSNEVLRALVLWIYTDVCRVSADCVLELLATANRYSCQSLRQMCEKIMAQNLDADNATEIMPYAAFYNAKTLFSACAWYIALCQQYSMTGKGEILTGRKEKKNRVFTQGC